jgi:hypothetical protein
LEVDLGAFQDETERVVKRRVVMTIDRQTISSARSARPDRPPSVSMKTAIPS